MIINSKVLHLPPYLSTHWNHIAAIHMDGTLLMITFVKGNVITIPNLPPNVIEAIFQAHASHLEGEKESATVSQPKNLHQAMRNVEQTMELPFRFGFSSFDGLGSALQHNQAQANAPDLPPEILQKISAIAKIVTPEDQTALPKAEPHCNCMHCQIARAITSGLQTKPEAQIAEESPVSDAELTFQPWDIQQTSDKLYTVTNRVDSLEKYTVYLGDPVGCTCGKTGCEHILAVLKS